MTDSIPIIINPDALFQLNRDPEILLVDVRSREEYDADTCLMRFYWITPA